MQTGSGIARCHRRSQNKSEEKRNCRTAIALDFHPLIAASRSSEGSADKKSTNLLNVQPLPTA